MISEFFVQLGTTVIGWFVGLIPDWDMPPELLDVDGMIGSLFQFAAGLGPWVDWAFVSSLALIPFSVWVIGFGWKALRTLASHFPGFGGAG